ncbi:hypothetical protein ACJRO7_034798 [Eucalyptus globulus]|uniref:Protein kinase domain-containing protein n=1 Tax=Eucalyptus globulus TaxID=34317 RepID=A0ABD3J3W2_EUCGL
MPSPSSTANHRVTGETPRAPLRLQIRHRLVQLQDVAVKVFSMQEYSEELINSFRQEASLMKRLRHPNVLLFMGAVTSPQRLCIVTDFLPCDCNFCRYPVSMELTVVTCVDAVEVCFAYCRGTQPSWIGDAVFIWLWMCDPKCRPMFQEILERFKDLQRQNALQFQASHSVGGDSTPRET